ncbi:MAG TPA: EamA family transporter [Longimicrobiales bacterium]|nr:EamA family transporter [Longimicrobiales bacterium]
MRDRVVLVAAFAAVYLVWGSTYLAIAWAVEGVPPMLMIGARCVIAGGILYGWARWRGLARPVASDWLAALVVGTLLFVTGQAVLAWAETRIASGPAAVLLATEPMFVAVFAWRGGRLVGIPRGERPDRLVAVAMVAGLSGVALMAGPGGMGAVDPWGAGAALVASASWSAGMLRARARPGLSPAGTAGMQLLAGGVVALLVSLATGGLGGTDPLVVTTRSALAFGYLVVFGSVITFGAYIWLLGRVGATRLSTHAYVNPVVAVALGVALAGEPLSPELLAASALILVSVVLMVRNRAPAGQSLPRRGVILHSSPRSSSVTT